MTSNDTDSWVLAIDFGTSNTAAAHTGAVSNAVEALPLGHDRTTMSSSVYVESPADIDVGDVAFDKAQRNPGGYLVSPKRSVAQGTTYVNGYDLPAHVPVASVLRSVMERARNAHDGRAPERLVLTHPEAWTEREVGVLVKAAEGLGLDADRISTISEPRAAANYYSRGATLSPGDRIGAFDFGGGTLDVAVMRATEAGTFDVIAARGDNQVGGKNFDAQIRRWVDEQLDETRPDVLEHLRTSATVEQLYSLGESIRRAKELLSETRTATISVPAPGEVVRVQITRDDLESIIAPSLHQAFELTRDTLMAGGIGAASDLSALYLTGGSSRIPAVHALLSRLGPIATLDDPKTVVAQGALAGEVPVLRGLGGRRGDAAPYGHRPGPGGTHDPHDPRGGGSSGRGGATGGRRRLVLAGAAIAAVLVVGSGAVLGVRALGSSGGDGGVPHSTQATTSTAGVAPGPLVDTDAIVAALPQKLGGDLEDCKVNGETSFGGREVLCNFVEGSTLVPDQSTVAGVGNFLTAAVDADAAASEILTIRNGVSATDGDTVNELVENEQRTAASRITGVENEPNNPLVIHYANTRTGAILTIFGFTSLAAARTFLAQSGLSA